MLDAKAIGSLQRSVVIQLLADEWTTAVRPLMTRPRLPTDRTLGCSILSQDHKVSIKEAQKQISRQNTELVDSVSGNLSEIAIAIDRFDQSRHYFFLLWTTSTMLEVVLCVCMSKYTMLSATRVTITDIM